MNAPVYHSSTEKILSKFVLSSTCKVCRLCSTTARFCRTLALALAVVW